jgi:hypothetical protein
MHCRTSKLAPTAVPHCCGHFPTSFATEGKVKADIELLPLSAIDQIFNRIEHGDVASRVVLDFTRD